MYNGQIIFFIYLFSLWHFQEVIEAQEKTINNLLKAVTEQHDQLDHQKVKIKNLEEKVYNCSTRFYYILSLRPNICFL